MAAFDYAQLGIYGPLCVAVMYLTYRHGWRGVVGWVYLFIFCVLRVVGPAMQITINSERSWSPSPSSRSSAPLISSIGISPILLATLGILHEARTYHTPKGNSFWEWLAIIFLHLLVGQGIGMLAAASSAFSGGTISASSKFLIKFGAGTLEVVWLIVVLAAIASLHSSQHSTETPGHKAGTKLLYAVFFSLPFLGIRITYTMVTLFTNMSNLVDGHLGMKVGLSFIPELIVVICFIAVGFVTRDIGLAKVKEQEMRARIRNMRLARTGGNDIRLKSGVIVEEPAIRDY